MAGTRAFDAGMATAQDAVAKIEHLLSSPDTDDFLFEVLASAFDILQDVDPVEMPEQPVIKRAANRDPILASHYLAARRRHQFYVLESDSLPHAEAKLG